MASDRTLKRPQSRARAILLAGLSLLAIGIVSAVLRAGHDESEATALRTKYEKALEEAAHRPPRFEIAYVRFALSDLHKVTAGGPTGAAYEIVPTEIARRIRAGGQALHPDFGTLPTRGRSYLASFARAYREHRVGNEKIFLAAVLVTQATPGKVAELQLHVEQASVEGFDEIFDLTDLTTEGRLTPRRPQVVRWTPSAGSAGALVPLCLLYAYPWHDLQVVSGQVLVPRRLVVGLPDGSELDVRPNLSPLDIKSSIAGLGQ